MPTDFACDGCALRFSVGWYHHHGFENGFAASTLLVCSRCFAQHQVDHAFDASRAPSSYAFFDVTIADVPPAARLLVMRRLREALGLSLTAAKRALDALPFTLGRDLPESLSRELEATYEKLGAVIRVTETRRKAVRDRAPQQHDRLLLSNEDGTPDSTTWRGLEIAGERLGVCGSFDLEKQVCGRCSLAGVLVADSDGLASSCPRCHSAIHKTGEWVT